MRTTALGIRTPQARQRRVQPMPTVHEDETVAFIQQMRRPIVLGAIDGLITTFVIVATALTGRVGPNVVGTVGIASLLADAFSMGVSEYLSSRLETSVSRAALLGAVCGVSFALAGALPLLSYLTTMHHEWLRYIVPVVVFVVSLIGLGVARLVVYDGSWQYVLEVLVSGSIAGGIAFGVAYHVGG